MAGSDQNAAPGDNGSYSDNGISAVWLNPDASSLVPDAGAPTPSVADHFNLRMGGALDFASMPSQIAPLDQVSAWRIGQHAGLGDTQTPDLAPLSGPMPNIQPAQLPADVRHDYAYQLQSGDVDGPQDFAEKQAGQLWRDATWSQPASWDDHAAQITNAAKSTAAALPTGDEVDTIAATLAQNTGQPADPATIDGIKGNLLDAYGTAGTSPTELLRRANFDADIRNALAFPQYNPVHYPTPEEVHASDLPVQDPLGNVDTDPAGLSGLIHMPAAELANQAKVGEMRAATNPDGTPKFTADDIFKQTMESPVLKFAAGLAAGKFIPQGISAAVGSNAASWLRDTVGQVAADESGQLKPGLGHNGGPTFGAIMRAAVDDSTIREAQDVTEGRTAAEARIRYNVGDATREKAIAKVMLEAHSEAVRPLLPGYASWIKNFQEQNRDVAQQRDAHVANGGDPNDIPAPVPTDYHPVQALYDHMENRPGGARLDPQSPLYPLANTMRALLDERKEGLKHDVSDTMGFWEDYVPHAWLDPRQQVEQAFKPAYDSGRQGNGYHLNGRDVPYIFDGIQRGLTPKFLNPIEGALHYIQSIDDFRAAERIRNQAIEHDGAYYATAPASPSDVALNGRAATRQRKYIGKDADGNPQARVINEKLYAPRGYGTVYNNWLGRGISGLPGDWGKYGGLLYDKWMATKNAITGMTFGLSGFHPFVMWTHSLGNALGEGMEHLRHGEIGSALADIGIAPVALGRDYLQGRRQSNVYLNKTGTPFEKTIADMWAKAGGASPTEGRGDTYFSSNARNLLDEWRSEGAWGLEHHPVLRKAVAPVALPIQALKSTARGLAAPMLNETESALRNTVLTIPRAFGTYLETIGRLTDTLGAQLFDNLIPNAKRGVIFDHMEAWLRRNMTAEPHETLAELRRTMDRVDNTFGEMNMRNVFWPTWAKQIANMMTVSMGWEYGSARWAGQSMQDITTRPSGERFSQNTRSLLGYIAGVGMFAAAYQYFKTGTLPSSLSNFAMPLTRAGDPTSAVQYPSEVKELVRIASLFQQAGLDPLKLIRVPFQYVGGKAQVMVRDAETFFNAKNTKDFLKKLYTNHQPAVMWNNSNSASLSPFERVMGFHSGPTNLTGAPTARQEGARGRTGGSATGVSGREIYRDLHPRGSRRARTRSERERR